MIAATDDGSCLVGRRLEGDDVFEVDNTHVPVVARDVNGAVELGIAEAGDGGCTDEVARCALILHRVLIVKRRLCRNSVLRDEACKGRVSTTVQTYKLQTTSHFTQQQCTDGGASAAFAACSTITWWLAAAASTIAAFSASNSASVFAGRSSNKDGATRMDAAFFLGESTGATRSAA